MRIVNQMYRQMNRRKFLAKASTALGTIAAGSSIAPGFLRGLSRSSAQDWTLRVGAPSKLMRVSGLTPWLETLQAEVKLASNGRCQLVWMRSDLCLSQTELLRKLKSGQIDIAVDSPLYGSLAYPAAAFFSHVPLALSDDQRQKWLVSKRTEDLWTKVYARFGFTALPFGGLPACFAQIADKEVQTVADYLALAEPRAYSKMQAQRLVHATSHLYSSSATHPGYSFELLLQSARWNKLGSETQQLLRESSMTVGRRHFEKRREQERRALVDVEAIGPTLKDFPESVVQFIADQNRRVVAQLRNWDSLAEAIYTSHLPFALEPGEQALAVQRS